MPLRRWAESANNAIEGILGAARSQRHLRYHLYAAAIVLLFCYVVGITKTEFLIISVTIMLIIALELLNTSIEAVVNLLSPEINEFARIAKDVAAGAVLTTAVGAVVIGYIILFPYLVTFFNNGLTVATHGGNDIAVLALLIVIILVVIIKALSKRGHPLRGGMPSGHAAVAFSIWVSITLITKNLLASVFAFAAALLIAQSRVAIRVHTKWEVLIGSVIGSLLTYALFRFFA
ncbi:diacylglycerol kinase [Candidatus Magnetomonas plexicatena]|uniref:diacylglycerol kinase n=1 Tax=Candidatus Magnetomonas plexicatena TaxID=2552947 RepID=UPI001C76FD98|nr:phosphatase PAP2 family protein [Nitrospirales bacterium LBB_01]